MCRAKDDPYCPSGRRCPQSRQSRMARADYMRQSRQAHASTDVDDAGYVVSSDLADPSVSDTQTRLALARRSKRLHHGVAYMLSQDPDPDVRAAVRERADWDVVGQAVENPEVRFQMVRRTRRLPTPMLLALAGDDDSRVVQALAEAPALLPEVVLDVLRSSDNPMVVARLMRRADIQPLEVKDWADMTAVDLLACATRPHPLDGETLAAVAGDSRFGPDNTAKIRGALLQRDDLPESVRSRLQGDEARYQYGRRRSQKVG